MTIESRAFTRHSHRKRFGLDPRHIVGRGRRAVVWVKSEIARVCRTNWTGRLWVGWTAIPGGTLVMSVVNENTLPVGQNVERGST